MSDMNDIEVWRAIKDSEGRYEVSNLGNVRSINRVVLDASGRRQRRRGRRLAIGISRRGYSQVGMYEDGKTRTRRVHSLVMATFIGPRPEGWHINHKDGNKQNNALSNLEYCTVADNQKHAYKTGLRCAPQGNASSVSKLTDEQAVEIIENREHLAAHVWASRFGVTRSCIANVARGSVQAFIARETRIS